jgi:flagellar biosynthesis/type III secretory pathway protein FliH
MQQIMKEAIIEKKVTYRKGELFEIDCHEMKEKGEGNAYLKGKQEGESLGYERAYKELNALFPLLRTLAGQLLVKRKEILSSLKIEMGELSLAICEKLLRTELSQKEKFLNLIHTYLEPLIAYPQEKIVVFLSPCDFQKIKSDLDIRYFENPDKDVELVFLSNEKLAQGDFRIETSTSIKDASLSIQIEDLRAQIF